MIAKGMGLDAFKEGDHPRAQNGQFGKGSGGGVKPKPKTSLFQARGKAPAKPAAKIDPLQQQALKTLHNIPRTASKNERLRHGLGLVSLQLGLMQKSLSKQDVDKALKTIGEMERQESDWGRSAKDNPLLAAFRRVYAKEAEKFD